MGEFTYSCCLPTNWFQFVMLVAGDVAFGLGQKWWVGHRDLVSSHRSLRHICFLFQTRSLQPQPVPTQWWLYFMGIRLGYKCALVARRYYVMLNDSSEHDISWTLRGRFFKFSTNVHLDLWMNWDPTYASFAPPAQVNLFELEQIIHVTWNH